KKMTKNWLTKIVSLQVAFALLGSSAALADQQFRWESFNSQSVDTTVGDVPAGAFKAGENGPIESVSDDSLYLCRGEYQNGVHPGKLWKSWCHIGWNGQEVLLEEFEVMITSPGNMTLNWVPSSRGARHPGNTLPGGYNDTSQGFGGYPLRVCQAEYQGGMHPGKLWLDMCHISWGGQEFPMTDYNLLTVNQ
ncbi:MAG: DM9 repeat-containing protein, partial [Cyanobacteria bacterium P01_F01_bin.53]